MRPTLRGEDKRRTFRRAGWRVDEGGRARTGECPISTEGFKRGDFVCRLPICKGGEQKVVQGLRGITREMWRKGVNVVALVAANMI